MKNWQKILLLCSVAAAVCFLRPAPTRAEAESADACCQLYPLSSDPGAGEGIWGHGAYRFMSGWSCTATDKTDLFYVVLGGHRQAAYCIQPGTPLNAAPTGGQTMDEDYWEELPGNETLTGDDIRLLCSRVLFYGFHGTVDDCGSWTTADPAAREALSRYLATQLLIWEVIVGERDGDFVYIVVVG